MVPATNKSVSTLLDGPIVCSSSAWCFRTHLRWMVNASACASFCYVMLCFVMFCYVAGNACLKQGIVLDRSHVHTNRLAAWHVEGCPRRETPVTPPLAQAWGSDCRRLGSNRLVQRLWTHELRRELRRLGSRPKNTSSTRTISQPSRTYAAKSSKEEGDTNTTRISRGWSR